MRASPSPLICERVRTQISMLLDAEVSELDRRLVAAHLARCAECRAFEQPVRAFTEELRATPLKSLREPVVLVRSRVRQRVWLKTAELGAAASVLIALLGVVGQYGSPESAGPTTDLFETSWQPELELAQIDASVPTRAADGPGPLGAV